MRLITIEGRAKEAANAWLRQYGEKQKNDILKSLRDLGGNPKPAEVDEVIGNQSWTRVTCDECGEDVDAAVEIGQYPDYDSATAEVCRSCLAEAIKLIII